MQYSQVRVLAGKGAEDDKFKEALRAVAVDQRGFLYAAGDSEIKVFDDAGRLRRRFSTRKPALAVAVSPDGRVFAGLDGQLEIFDTEGRRTSALSLPRLGLVTAIGFTKGHFLLGDARGRVIRRFDETAAHRNDIGNDNRTKGLLIPNGVVSFGVDEKGILHVANPGKHRVERYTPQGELLGHFGRFDGHDPEGFTGCCNPTNVAVSGSRIFVTEKAGPRAKVYDFAGKLVAVIAADVFDSNCKNMSIAAGPRGRVYVADTVKLQIFAFEPGAA